VGGRLLARARPRPLWACFSPDFSRGVWPLFPGRGRAAASGGGSARCLLYSASRAKLGLVAVVRAERVCIYDGFQLCVGLGFPVRRRGFFCAGGLLWCSVRLLFLVVSAVISFWFSVTQIQNLKRKKYKCA